MVVTTHSVPRVIMRGVEVDNMVFICSFGRRSTGVLVVVDEESCRRNSKKYHMLYRERQRSSAATEDRSDPGLEKMSYKTTLAGDGAALFLCMHMHIMKSHEIIVQKVIQLHKA